MSRLVAGMFRNRVEANDAIRSLLADGVPRNEISLLMSDATRRREFAGEPVTGANGEVLRLDDVDRLAVESIMVPGVGVLASGPIFDAMVSHPTAHTVRDALRAIEVSRETAERLAEALHHGGIVLAVEAAFGDETLIQANLGAMGSPDLGVSAAMRTAAIAEAAAQDDDDETETETDEDDDLDESWSSVAVFARHTLEDFHKQG